uniref:Synaptobrevin family protein n=2 Tax=Wuchereria bancrofti TaxID=6293 RepID=A0AAF5RTU2_WUCBA
MIKVKMEASICYHCILSDRPKKVKMESFSLPVMHIGRVTTLDSSRVQKTQRELEEVEEIVRSDIDRIFEREGRLKNLTVRADEMEARAERFSRKAIQVRRNIWWRSVRLTITIVCACMLFVVGVIVLSISAKNDKDSP